MTTMLRFFSRRKIKGGRAEQKAGAGGRRPLGKPTKGSLACNIMLLDGSDLALEIGVRSCYVTWLPGAPTLHLDWSPQTYLEPQTPPGFPRLPSVADANPGSQSG